MWVSGDGHLNTAACSLQSVEHLLPSPGRRAELAGQLADFDPWRDGGIGESIADEVGKFRIDPDEESRYEAQPLPMEVIDRFGWNNIADADSAEIELAKVPLRWRLDMADVIDDVIDSLE
ncbi:hypothetical protein ACPW96_21520 [Micromonospora sp. DT81.3]|uniref:hypothetical protein n=1 Tax=Micromonospora sp. DT81.3 TaxID=3416523 RepID=UPI003CF410D5